MKLKEKISFIKSKNKIGMILIAIILILCSIIVFADNALIQGLILGANDEETLVRMATSISKGSALNNQVEVDSLGILFEKYVGTGLVNVSQHSTETIRVEFTQTGNIYDINILDGLIDLSYNEIYTITYNANGGTLSPQVQVAKKDQTTRLSKIQPIREGYIFLGWSITQTSTTAEYAPESEYTGNENVILYAIWEEEPQLEGTLADITNDNIGEYIDLGNDVIGTDGRTTNDWRILYVENDKVYAILADFLPNSTNYATNAGLATTNLYNVNSNVSRADFLTKLTTNSSWIGLANGLSGATATGAPTRDLILKSYNTENNQPSSNTTFDITTPNYSLYVSHSGEWNGCQDYWLATANDSSEASMWSVSYSGAFGQNDYNNTYIGIRPVVCLPSNLNVTKYGDIWVVSHNAPETIRISFDANGGIGAPGYITIEWGQDAEIPSTIPTRDGYIFLGWNIDQNATTAIYAAGGTIPAANIIGNMTLYAIWQEIPTTVTITYDANEGEGAPSAETVELGSDATVPNIAPTRSGYTFLGWSKDQNATTATYEIGDTIPAADITENITLYAIWKQRYTITYNANEGTGAPEQISVLAGQDATLSATEPTRDGYTFLGWSKESNATTATYTAGGTIPAADITENITLYAIWQQLVQYTITFDACSGSFSSGETTKTITVTEGSSATAITDEPTATNSWYKFQGWATTKPTYSGTGTVTYAAGAEIPASAITGDMTLYAVYKYSYGT